MSEFDLSGAWTGVFNFPRLLPPGQFEATIREIDGKISGVTTERGDDFDPPGTILDAVIEGHRVGSSVLFHKIYGDELRPDVVYYDGTIQPGGDEIQGEWTIPGEWSGTFLMIRANRQERLAEKQVSEEV